MGRILPSAQADKQQCLARSWQNKEYERREERDGQGRQPGLPGTHAPLIVPTLGVLCPQRTSAGANKARADPDVNEVAYQRGSQRYVNAGKPCDQRGDGRYEAQ